MQSRCCARTRRCCFSGKPWYVTVLDLPPQIHAAALVGTVPSFVAIDPTRERRGVRSGPECPPCRTRHDFLERTSSNLRPHHINSPFVLSQQRTADLWVGAIREGGLLSTDIRAQVPLPDYIGSTLLLWNGTTCKRRDRCPTSSTRPGRPRPRLADCSGLLRKPCMNAQPTAGPCGNHLAWAGTSRGEVVRIWLTGETNNQHLVRTPTTRRAS